jgi:hypothetical protein
MFFDPFRGENDGSTAKSSHLKRGDSYVVSLQLCSSTPLLVRLQPKTGRICVKIKRVSADLGINATLFLPVSTAQVVGTGVTAMSDDAPLAAPGDYPVCNRGAKSRPSSVRSSRVVSGRRKRFALRRPVVPVSCHLIARQVGVDAKKYLLGH